MRKINEICDFYMYLVYHHRGNITFVDFKMKDRYLENKRQHED